VAEEARAAVAARGLLMGNRGRLHDAQRRIVRYAQGRRWIACLTRFKGRRRTVMSPRSYTELFFLDETVALAAGHRPCVECRRDDFLRFRAAWTAAGGDGRSVDEIDRRLHADRLTVPGARRFYRDEIDALPDGVHVEIDGAAWLIWGGALHAWSAASYTARRAIGRGPVTVITPQSIVGAIRAGYAPGVHPSAD